MADLNIAILVSGKDAGAGNVVAQIRNDLGAMPKAAKSAASSLGGLVSGLGGIGLAAGGLTAIAGGVASIAQGMVSGNAQMETYETQLGTLLGSADAAKNRLAELARFGATTPFELPEVVRAEKVLLGFGLTGQKALDLTSKSGEELRTVIGDVAAGTGASFEEIALNFGKFSAGATGEAISRFQEMGIVTREQLADMGIQFSKSGELISPLPEAMTAAVQIAQSKFGGGMDQLSRTFSGQMSTLSDNFNQVKNALAAPIFDAMRAGVGQLNTVLGSEGFQAVIAQTVDVLEGMGAFVSDNIGPILATLAATLGAVVVPAFLAWATTAGAAAAATIAALLPVVAPIAAIGAAAFLLSKAWSENWFDIQGKLEAVWAFMEPILTAVYGELARFWTEIQPELAEAWDNIRRVVTTGIQAAWDAIAPVVETLVTFWRDNWGTISLVLETVWATMTGLIRVQWEIFKGVITVGLNLLQGDWQGAWDAAKNALDAAWSAMRGILERWMDLFADAFRAGWRAIESLLSTGIENMKVMFSNAGTALMDLLRTGLMRGADSVLAPIRKMVADVAALLPHSYADVGPLSEPVDWTDPLMGTGEGELTAVVDDVLAAFTELALEVGVSLDELDAHMLAFVTGTQGGMLTVAESFSGAAEEVGKATEEMSGYVEGVNGMLDAFVKGTQGGMFTEAVASVESATKALKGAEFVMEGYGANLPKPRTYVTPTEAMGAEVTGPVWSGQSGDLVGLVEGSEQWWKEKNFQRQGGGPVVAGFPYLVGERGTELFVPEQSGYIVPHDRLSRRMGGPTYNIHGAGTEEVLRLIERRDRERALLNRW